MESLFSTDVLPVIGTCLVGFFVFALLSCLINRYRWFPQRTQIKETHFEEESSAPTKAKKQSPPKVPKKVAVGHDKSSQAYVCKHGWLVTTLKGHSGACLDAQFSSNGKYLASCSDDRTLLLWKTKDFQNKDHRSVRTNIDLDHLTRICFSSDSKGLVGSLASENSLAVYKLAKKDKDASSHDCKFVQAESVVFPSGSHSSEIIAVAMSCNGTFIMSASADTTLIIWDLKGNILKIIDTLQGENYFADVSPCGRFIGSGGFMPDAKFWEVKFDKSGNFIDAVRAFELKGHRSGIHSFGCNADTTRVVTASKEGTWKLWNTNVNYALNQEPYLLQTGPLDPLKTSPGARVAFAPNGHSFAISTGPDLHIFEGETGLLSTDGIIAKAHAQRICSLVYSPDGDYIATTGDRYVNIFANIPGMREYLRNLQKQLKGATNESQKARLEGLIAETDKKMKSLVGEIK